jgi:hypothetical protein
MTTKIVADYYEVGESLIRYVVMEYNDEIKIVWYKVVKKKEVSLIFYFPK